MARILFSKEPGIYFNCASGSNLMKEVLASGHPVASSCGGDGVCGKCRLQVISGMDSLSKPTELERHLQEKYGLKKNERISCQTQVLGEVVIDASYW